MLKGQAGRRCRGAEGHGLGRKACPGFRFRRTDQDGTHSNGGQQQQQQ